MSTAKMMQLQILILVPLFFLPTTDVIIHPAYQQWKNEKTERQNTAHSLVQYLAESNRQLMEQTRLLLTVLSKSTPVVREDSESCRSLFSDILKNQPFFSPVPLKTTTDDTTSMVMFLVTANINIPTATVPSDNTKPCLRPHLSAIQPPG